MVQFFVYTVISAKSANMYFQISQAGMESEIKLRGNQVLKYNLVKKNKFSNA